MTTTSSVSSTNAVTAPTINTGSAQDVSSLIAGNISISLADEVTSKVQPIIDQATSVQTEISTNQTKIAAYQNMQSLLQALQTATANLSSQPLQGSDVFESRVANLSSNTATAASSILSATVASNTNTGNHTVVVNAIAQAESDVSATQNVSTTTALSLTGSFTIAEQGEATPVSVSVTSGMSLTDIADAINGATTQNGVTASVVSIDSSHSALVIAGVDPDTPLQFTDSGVLSSLGVYSNSPTLTGTVPSSGSSTALGLSGSSSSMAARLRSASR